MELTEEHSPLNSKKELPKNHNIEARYHSYERANDYIIHLSRVYDSALQKSSEYDFSCIESLKFKSKLPLLHGKFKLSCYPNSRLSKELLEKIAMINAYNNLSECNVSRSKVKNKTYSSSSPKSTNIQKESAKIKFSINNSSLCLKCKFSDCKCKLNSFYLNKKMKVAQSLNFPELSKNSKLRPPFVIRSKNDKYFMTKKKKRLEDLGTSLDNSLSLSPRKIISNSVNDYYISGLK